MRDPSQHVSTGNDTALGYAQPGYARSLAEFGDPLELPRSGGWLLRRDIPGAGAWDAVGPYPLFACREGGALAEDMRELDDHLVSVALVADPFGAMDETDLRRAFHRVTPFKTHFVADLSQPLEQFTSSSHRSFGRQALRRMTVDVCPEPLAELDTWCRLYDGLIARHSLKGIKCFSRAAFAQQLALPGLVMFRARVDDRVIGLDLWYVKGDVATGHLVAMSTEGYALRASYGLKLHLLNYFRGRVRYVNLGGGAGLNGDGADGLSAFKRGWSNATRIAHFCARICDAERYATLARANRGAETSYFPAYRQPEF